MSSDFVELFVLFSHFRFQIFVKLSCDVTTIWGTGPSDVTKLRGRAKCCPFFWEAPRHELIAEVCAKFYVFFMQFSRGFSLVRGVPGRARTAT